MASTKLKLGVASTITFLLYVTYCVLTAISLYSTETDLFPESDQALNDRYNLLMFPTNKTYTIFVVVYVVQFIWLLYSLSCMCRQGSGTETSSIKFYFFFSLSLFFGGGAAFSWYRDQVVPTFILTLFFLIALMLAFGITSYDLSEYLKTHELNADNSCDIWCHRILVQNGVLFALATTTLFAFILTVAVFLNAELGASDFSVSLGMLILIGVVNIIWFFLETFPLKLYTEYTFASHIVVIYYLSGLVANVWGKDKTIAGFAIFFLAATCIIFIVRIFILAYRSSKRASYENITYNVKTETVNA